jgi:hypothetical protein
LRRWRDEDLDGFAAITAQAVVAHARAELGLRRLVSVHVVGNEASARVMVKLGMSLERETVQPDTGRRVRVYAMDASGRVQGPAARRAAMRTGLVGVSAQAISK